MKALMAGALLVILSGCANAVPSLPEMMARSKWTGRSMDEAVAKWGTPSGIQQAEAGQYVASWGSSSQFVRREAAGTSVAPGGPGVIVTEHYRDRLITNECRLELTFNEQNIITKFNTWQNRGGGCADFYWGENSP